MSVVRAAAAIAGPTDMLALYIESNPQERIKKSLMNLLWFRDENGYPTEVPVDELLELYDREYEYILYGPAC